MSNKRRNRNRALKHNKLESLALTLDLSDCCSFYKFEPDAYFEPTDSSSENDSEVEKNNLKPYLKKFSLLKLNRNEFESPGKSNC